MRASILAILVSGQKNQILTESQEKLKSSITNLLNKELINHQA